MAWALAITVGVLLVEAVGAAVTGSLALLADAGHMAGRHPKVRCPILC